MLAAVATAGAAAQPAPTDPGSATRVETSIELGVQLAGQRNLFWNLPDAYAPSAGYDTDRH